VTPQISDLFTQARAFWQEASTPTRAAIAGGAVFLIIVAVGMALWASSPDFVRVPADSPAAAQALAKEMDKAGIPYQISEDGSALSVRRSDLGRARQVAGGISGAAQASLGLRGLDSMGPFTTYEQQRVRIERAQEEALESALAQYNGVQRVSVNLALPAQNALVGVEAPPKAAVILTPLPGNSFDEAQVAAMAYVVANSVPDLTPENVTIASAQGVTLWAGADSASGTAGTGALKNRTRAEKEFIRARQADLQSNLDRVFGAGRALVYVDATLDLDRQETEAVRVLPAGDNGKGLPVSERTETKQYTGAAGSGGAAAAGGVAGMEANAAPGIPSYPAAAGGGNSAGSPELYKTTEETTNYDNTTEKVNTVKAAGEPKRMNVSIWVDDKLSPAVQNAIRTWVEGSVVNPANAATTKVTVVPAPFDRTAQTAALAARAQAENQAKLAAYAPYVVLPACLFGLLLAAWFLTRGKRVVVTAAGRGGGAEPALAAAAGAAGATSLPPGASVDDLLLSSGDLSAAGVSVASGGGGDGTDMLPAPEILEMPPIHRIQEKIEPELEAILEFIDDRPETAALLLRTWTVEEPRVKAG
jgi:flagellar M-ring protein FliF